MPPRRKPRELTEEEKKTKFEEFEKSEEYALMAEFRELKKQYPDISETTPDLTDKLQPLISLMYKMGRVYVKKTKIKEFKHEHFRTCFFCKKVAVYDEQEYKTEKVHEDGAYRNKHNFMHIYKAVDELHELNHENFLEFKKKMTDFCKLLFTDMVPYIKDNHKLIIDQIINALKPIKATLESNFKMAIFDYQFDNEKDRLVNDFKEKALVERFCADLQVCWGILYRQGKIPMNPDLMTLYRKFHIPGWRENPIQKYFVFPLRESWNTMRKNLVKLYSFGMDHWKIPLSENQDFVKDTLDLIAKEDIAERLLGDSLKRDQLDFMYRTVKYIYDTPARQKLIDSDTGLIDSAIPKLTILFYLDNICRINKMKKEDAIKKQKEESDPDPFKQTMKSSTVDPLGKSTLSGTGNLAALEETKGQPAEPSSPSKKDKRFDIYAKDFGKAPSALLSIIDNHVDVDPEDTEENIHKYGRYWIWRDYMLTEIREDIINAAETLNDINVAVRQDMADQLVTEGMRPKARNLAAGGEKAIDEFKKFMDALKMKDTKREDNVIRPPFLWNHPDHQEKSHQYRTIAHPQECYIDGRIDQMISKIDDLADYLVRTEPERWQFLVSSVVKSFKDLSEKEKNQPHVQHVVMHDKKTK